MKKIVFNILTVIAVATSAHCFGANAKETAAKTNADIELQEQSGPMTPTKLRNHVAQLAHQGLKPKEHLIALDCAKRSANSLHSLALKTNDQKLEGEAAALILELSNDERTIHSSMNKTSIVN